MNDIRTFKKEAINKITNSYIKHLESITQDAETLERCHEDNPELVKSIYRMSTIDMCIKYESFTAEIIQKLTKWSIEYNRPWAYTRKAAKILNINIDKEYKHAHKIWDYYNALKHVNNKTRFNKLKIKKELRLDNNRITLEITHKALNQLLNKFIIK